MNRKLSSLFIFIVDGDCSACQERDLDLLGKARDALNKNPSSSDKTRTPHNSGCNGFPSVPPSSQDKIALHPSTAPRRISCLFDFP
jgi:hypothetical protein